MNYPIKALIYISWEKSLQAGGSDRIYGFSWIMVEMTALSCKLQ